MKTLHCIHIYKHDRCSILNEIKKYSTCTVQYSTVQQIGIKILKNQYSYFKNNNKKDV